ncbi:MULTISPECIES: TadE/TadG family type IV pilus assembly protein [Sphingobium]|uniref:TadE/TadG family type IV pilus assembly protein n=1 Tax=Sphingobium sp. MI1205 TaxID=407020 RepID=UPI000770058A|nr:TadE family protein [Sphingobium sp. MI1205]AMK18456.1 TadE family protein [Sphingobium sp. MI1205]
MKINKILGCVSGAAAAEMALILPVLITLMFGSFEIGNYFLNQHVVVKAVRDGARFASRQNFSYFPCNAVDDDLDPLGNVAADTQLITRTGQVTTGGMPRMASWTDAAHISVKYDCVSTASNADYSGIYAAKDYLPVVKVRVSAQPYSSLFASMGLFGTSLTLNAESQATVAGI